MMTPTFRYERAASVEEALALLASHGDEAKCSPAATRCCR